MNVQKLLNFPSTQLFLIMGNYYFISIIQIMSLSQTAFLKLMSKKNTCVLELKTFRQVWHRIMQISPSFDIRFASYPFANHNLAMMPSCLRYEDQVTDCWHNTIPGFTIGLTLEQKHTFHSSLSHPRV